MMNDPNMTTLGEMIKAFYHDHQKDSALDEQRILDSWAEVVGDFVAQHTLKTSISKGILYVKVDADSLKSEILFSKSMLIRKLNSKVEGEILKDIFLL